MSALWSKMTALIAAGEVRVSEHGYDQLVEDGLTLNEVLGGVVDAQIVEEYPEFPKGPTILVLQKGKAGAPVHVVWGIPRGYNTPVVLITAYRPDPKRWEPSFKNRVRP